jgi:hypothetical protein
MNQKKNSLPRHAGILILEVLEMFFKPDGKKLE